VLARLFMIRDWILFDPAGNPTMGL